MFFLYSEKIAGSYYNYKIIAVIMPVGSSPTLGVFLLNKDD